MHRPPLPSHPPRSGIPHSLDRSSSSPADPTMDTPSAPPHRPPHSSTLLLSAISLHPRHKTQTPRTNSYSSSAVSRGLLPYPSMCPSPDSIPPPLSGQFDPQGGSCPNLHPSRCSRSMGALQLQAKACFRDMPPRI